MVMFHLVPFQHAPSWHNFDFVSTFTIPTRSPLPTNLVSIAAIMSEACHKPYEGTITYGSVYAEEASITCDVTKIPFKPWKAGSEWQFCDSKKFAGNGFLLKKMEWKKFFHLSIYPSPSAFEEMEWKFLNPTGLGGGVVPAVTCACGKRFWPSIPNQSECVQCMVKAKDALKMQLTESQSNEEAQRLELETLKLVGLMTSFRHNCGD